MKELLKSLRMEMKRRKEILVTRLRNLAIDLNRVADRLDRDDWLEQIKLINDFGEIQVRSTMIDVQCGVLRAYQRIYDEIVKREKEDE